MGGLPHGHCHPEGLRWAYPGLGGRVAPDNEQRREERVPASLRVGLDKGSGVTRDVSASGVFFETEAAYAAGSTIRFTIDLGTPGGDMVLSCQGDIVRVENRGGRIGVAVKITESSIRAAAATA
jgi:hypothetical protein